MAYVQPPPPTEQLLAALAPEDLMRVLAAPISDEDYLHWDQIRHREPPTDLTREEWWLRLKMTRGGRPLPLVDIENRHATISAPDKLLEALHFIDQNCAGEIAMEEAISPDNQSRHRFLVNSIMEEAIRSSQLEGATTSRREAKQLLQSGRAAKDRSEQMILNNYRAMMHIRTELGDNLTPDDVLELHRVVTEGTLDDPTAAGRLQTPDEERVAVYRAPDGQLLHRPPPAEQLPGRLEAMCAFANGETPSGHFIHPVVRAILLHYWLGYDHPFEDGNGRTARALFYWSMRRDRYWLTEFLSISRILRQAPAQYSKAYLYSETDESDTTYFVIYQLQVIRRAVDELHEYLQRKMKEVRKAETLVRADAGFNHRQVALLGNALRTGDHLYTARGHGQTHGVTAETARTDLIGLEQRGLLQRRKVGRQHQWIAPVDLADRLGDQE